MLPLLRFYRNISNILEVLNPVYHYRLWRDKRTMYAFLTPIVQRRLDVFTSQKSGKPGRTVLDLSMKAIQDEGAGKGVIPEGFIEDTIGNINTFLFAGHDTTATLIGSAVHLLEQNSRILAKLREELDAVFGPASHSAPPIVEQLRSNPNLANNLPYTHAIVKETLRVYTNVGTFRRGKEGFFLHGPADTALESMAFPTNGFLLWDANCAIHMRPELWERADEALPERWLFADNDDDASTSLKPENVARKAIGQVDAKNNEKTGNGKFANPTDSLRPPSNGWRPFAAGPRNCIGQHLAIMESKLVLAMLYRELDIECAWEEWDRVRGFTGKPPNVNGDRCYQVYPTGPPKLKDGMPVHVRLRMTSTTA
jgi:cytochrome P450